MSIEKCAFHADSRSSASEDISKLNRKATSVLQTNSVNEESKMGRNVEVLNLSLGTALGLPRNPPHWITASCPLLAHVLHDSWSLPSSISHCLHRQWRLLQCGWNWRMNAIFREEKHRLPDQCSVLLVALKRSRTESKLHTWQPFREFSPLW